MSTSMAYGRKGGKEGAAEDMGKGKGKGKDMVKGWGSLPNQSSHLLHMHLLQRAQAHETGTRTFEQQQVEFAEDKRTFRSQQVELFREATKDRWRQVAVFMKGNGVKGHGKGGFDYLEPPALPRGSVGKAQKGSQSGEGNGKRKQTPSIDPNAKRQRQATEARLPDANRTGDKTPEQTPEELLDEQLAALKSEFENELGDALVKFIVGTVRRAIDISEDKILKRFKGKGEGKGEGEGDGTECAAASDKTERACPIEAVTEVASVPRSADEKEDEASNNELTKESDEKVKEKKSRRR